MEPRTRFAIIMVCLVVLAAVGLQVVWRVWPETKPGKFIASQLMDYYRDKTTNNNTNSTLVTPDVNDVTVVSTNSSVELPHHLASSIVAQSADQYLVGWVDDNQYWLERDNSDWVSLQPAVAVVNNLPLIANQSQRPQLVAHDTTFYVGWLAPYNSTTDYELHVTTSNQSDIVLEGITIPSQSLQYRFTVSSDRIVVAVAQVDQAIRYAEFSLTGALLSQQTVVQSGSPIGISVSADNAIVIVSQLKQQIVFTKFTGQFGNTVSQFAIPLSQSETVPEPQLVDFVRTPNYILILGQTADQSALQVWSWNKALTQRFNTLTIPGTVLHPYLAKLTDSTVILGSDTVSFSLHLADGLLQ